MKKSTSDSTSNESFLRDEGEIKDIFRETKVKKSSSSEDLTTNTAVGRTRERERV